MRQRVHEPPGGRGRGWRHARSSGTNTMQEKASPCPCFCHCRRPRHACDFRGARLRWITSNHTIYRFSTFNRVPTIECPLRALCNQLKPRARIFLPSTFPKTTCLPSNQEVTTVHRKNWEPFVLAPAFACQGSRRGYSITAKGGGGVTTTHKAHTTRVEIYRGQQDLLPRIACREQGPHTYQGGASRVG